MHSRHKSLLRRHHVSVREITTLQHSAYDLDIKLDAEIRCHHRKALGTHTS